MPLTAHVWLMQGKRQTSNDAPPRRTASGPGFQDASNPSFGTSPDAEIGGLPDRPDQLTHHVVDIPAVRQASNGRPEPSDPPPDAGTDGRSNGGEASGGGMGQGSPGESWLQLSKRKLMGSRGESQSSGRASPEKEGSGQEGLRRLVVPMPIIKPALVSPGYTASLPRPPLSSSLPSLTHASTSSSA